MLSLCFVRQLWRYQTHRVASWRLRPTFPVLHTATANTSHYKQYTKTFPNSVLHTNANCNITTIKTGCPRRDVPDFGRAFLMLKYTDRTQNTYVQSWTVTEIMAREKSGLLAGPHTVPVSWQSCPFPSLSVVSYGGNSAHASHRTARVLPSVCKCSLPQRCEWLVG